MSKKVAAVPFSNVKGERSMKHVKVQRYVAGKRPVYAGDESDSSSSYISEDEEYSQDNDYQTDESSSQDKATGDDRLLEHTDRNDKKTSEPSSDEEDDDPRFRRLKQIESKRQTTGVIGRRERQEPKRELTVMHIEEDDDEDEEKIRERHILAKNRKVEEPIGSKAIFKDDTTVEQTLTTNKPSKRLDTDDFLIDFKITGFSLNNEPKTTVDEGSLKQALVQAKLDAKLKQQLNKRIEEDLKREIEREALAKADIGAKEMTSVQTDDEDDELAYEQWKLREIQRVLRDKSERMLYQREHSRLY